MKTLKDRFAKVFNVWIIWKAGLEDRFYARKASPTYSLNLINELISQRRYHKPKGGLKILKVYKNNNWEDVNLLPALRAFGEVREYPLDEVRPYSLRWQVFGKFGFNRRFLNDVGKLVQDGKINVIFFYSSGLVFQPKTIKSLSLLGVPMINLALDDYLKFKGYPTLTGWSGNVGLARYMTLTMVSYKEACHKYLVEGAIPLYLPEGGNPAKFKPLEGVSKDIDVCFVGKNYGIRAKLVDFLVKNGIKIEVHGRGWPNGPVSHEKMIELYSRAKIALGMSDSWGSGRFDIPGRDFEVPLIGPLYLTEKNDKIGTFYKIGEEIVLYQDWSDLLQKIRYYLSHDTEREAIAQKGRARALKEHTWEKRFATVFKMLSLN